jgi:hypothetical protein
MEKTAVQKLIDVFNHIINDFKDIKDPEDIAYKRGFEDALMHAKQALKLEKKQRREIACAFFHWNNKGILTNGLSKTEDAFEYFLKNVYHQNK